MKTEAEIRQLLKDWERAEAKAKEKGSEAVLIAHSQILALKWVLDLEESA